MCWRKADDPPAAGAGHWSRRVVVLSNLGDIYLLSYFQGTEGGVWQRPYAFKKGERVECWVEQPEGFN